MSNKFNNTTGTTAPEFRLAAGTNSEVRHVVLTASNVTSAMAALDRYGNEIAISGIEFYDLKVVAIRNSDSAIASKNVRGTISSTTVTRIEDIFQEDHDADVVLTSDGTTFTVSCTSSGTSTFTVYATLVKVVA
jgi:hypothetical protein